MIQPPGFGIVDFMPKSSRAQKYLEEFWSLSIKERSEVLDDIAGAAAPTEDPTLLDEIDRRLDAYDRGEAVLREPEDVARYIRSKFPGT